MSRLSLVAESEDYSFLSAQGLGCTGSVAAAHRLSS